MMAISTRMIPRLPHTYELGGILSSIVDHAVNSNIRLHTDPRTINMFTSMQWSNEAAEGTSRFWASSTLGEPEPPSWWVQESNRS